MLREVSRWEQADTAARPPPGGSGGRQVAPRRATDPCVASNSAAVSAATVAPPVPPVVPFWPQAFTDAKPAGAPATRQLPGSGGVVGGVLPVGSGPGPGVSTTTSSNEAEAYEVTSPIRPERAGRPAMSR